MTTWCVWMKIPTGKAAQDGWSRVAGGMTQEQAEWMSGQLFFDSRAMPDQPR